MKKLLLLLFILTNVNIYALDLGDLSTLIRVQIDDNNADSSKFRYSTNTLTLQINTVQSEMAKYARCLIVSTSVAAVANQSNYNLPDDCFLITRVAFAINNSTTNYKRLGRWSIAELDKDKAFWQGYGAGLPNVYNDERAGFITLVPAPSTAYATAASTQVNIQIDYMQIPINLAADNDIPFNSKRFLYPYHELIVTGVLGKYYVADKRQEYYTLLEKMRVELLDKPDVIEQYKIK